MAGKVLERGRHTVGVVGGDKRMRLCGDDGGVGGEAAAQGADHWVIGVAVDVDYWGKVVVDPRSRQRLGHRFRLRIGEGRIVAFAQCLR